MYELDRITQLITQAVLQAARDQQPVARIRLGDVAGDADDADNTVLELQLPAGRPDLLSVAALSRQRRQFIQLNKMHAIHERARIGRAFVDYLRTNASGVS